MRTHLHFTVTPDGAAGGAAYGLIVGRALDVGPGVGPNPNSDSELDWMLLDRWHPDMEGGPFTDTHSVVVDNRSKRRMGELGQRYLFCIQNSNAVAQTPRVWARTLLALP